MGEASIYLLDAFFRISGCRASGINGPEGLHPKDYIYWCALTGEKFSGDEFAILMAADDSYMEAYRKETARLAANKESKPNG